MIRFRRTTLAGLLAFTCGAIVPSLASNSVIDSDLDTGSTLTAVVGWPVAAPEDPQRLSALEVEIVGLLDQARP